TVRGDFDLTPSLQAEAKIDYFDNEQTLQTRLSHNDQQTWNYMGSLKQAFDGGRLLTFTAFGSDSRFETDNTGGFAGIPENQAEFIQNVHHTPVDDQGASLVWSQSLSDGWLRGYEIGADYHQISGTDSADIFDQTGAFVRTDIGSGKQRFIGAFAQA